MVGGAGVALGEGGGEGAEVAHGVGLVGREEEFGVVDEVERGDGVVNGIDEVEEFGFGFGGELKGAVVDEAVVVWSDEEDVAFGDGVIVVGTGGGEEEFVEAELERVAVEGGVAGPFFGVVFAGFEIIKGEGFGVGMKVDVVDCALDGNTGGGEGLAWELDLGVGVVGAEKVTEGLEGNGEIVGAALLELAQFGADQRLGLSLVVEVGEGVVVVETITGDALEGLVDEVAVGEVEAEGFVGSAEEQATIDGFGAGVDEVKKSGEVGGGEAVML